MQRERMALVIVGHVDHGKSTLIGRLLYDTGSLAQGKIEEIQEAACAQGQELEFAFLMDHLREERERAMTIDTAQTFFSSPAREYVIIDAPGHKEFLKNMVTGASQADAAVLLCSVAEGVQEQTRRHAFLLKLLGLEQVVVAYNKMDRAGYDRESFQSVRTEMNAFLGRLGVRPTFEIPISASRGDNVATRSPAMPWHEGPSLVEALDMLHTASPQADKPLRFPVQDVYEREGVRFVVGRVESGLLRPGQRLRFLPDGPVAIVQRIVQFARPDLSQAEPGECVGVVFDRQDLRRGLVGCPEGGSSIVTRRFQASVFWLASQPLEGACDGLAFRCATQERPCRIVSLRERIDSGTLERLPVSPPRLEDTEVGEAIIETNGPVVLESFYDVAELGRFVLVRGRHVVAGGIVTQPIA